MWINDSDTITVNGVIDKSFAGYYLTGYSEAFPTLVSNGSIINVYYSLIPVFVPTTTDTTTTINDPTIPTSPAGSSTTQTPSAKLIDDESTPLASGAAWALINLICTVITLLAAVYTFFAKRKNKKDEQNDTDEDKKKARFTKTAKIISIALTIVAIVSFILTENMRLPMVLVDKWTILMVVYVVFQIVDMTIGRTKKATQKEKQTANV